MLFILTSARPLILYVTTNFWWNCGQQVFQANSGPGLDHTYQTDPSSLSLTINLQVYFLCCLVSCKAVSLDPCCFSSTLMIYFILIFIILYLLLQMTPSALDLLPTALTNSYCNMISIYYLTGVLDHIYVSTLPNVYIFHLEPTESHHITWTNK